MNTIINTLNNTLNNICDEDNSNNNDALSKAFEFLGYTIAFNWAEGEHNLIVSKDEEVVKISYEDSKQDTGSFYKMLVDNIKDVIDYIMESFKCIYVYAKQLLENILNYIKPVNKVESLA